MENVAHKKPQRTAISMLKIVHIKMPQYRILCMCPQNMHVFSLEELEQQQQRTMVGAREQQTTAATSHLWIIEI